MRYLYRLLMRTPVGSRRFGLLLCLLGFVWGITLIQLTFFSFQQGNSYVEAEHIQNEILELSKRYIKVLSQEDRGLLDTPYSGKMTGYDMKKTMAVLLDSMMQRIENLEGKLAALHNRSSGGKLLFETVPPDVPLNVKGLPPKANFRDLLAGKMENCEVSETEKKDFPHCIGKMAWMKAHWQSDKCYQEYGVDGSDCSFRVYLSEIEKWCPLLPGRSVAPPPEKTESRPMAALRTSQQELMNLLKDPGSRGNYAWIRSRIERMWPKWIGAIHNLTQIQDLSNRPQQKIVVHLGLLTRASKFGIAESADKGGPLGELVQWSDIISSLYILGHDLTVTSEVEQLSSILSQFSTAESQCQTREKLPLDIIITDIIGLTQFRRKVKKGYGKFSCLLRIVDSFGTEPSFNYDAYAKGHGMKTQWGMQNLNPQQFFTMFPHTPDNSFMGFVVDSETAEVNVPKKNQAVVYGKAEYMWKDKKTYLDIIKEFVDIHGTVYHDSKKNINAVPSYVRNHGILPGPDLHKLLQESKLFIGLGFPYEGPAPLEAIAQGCIFINPKFLPPHNSANTRFFKGKPTLRQVTSQHPYTEDFIGEPHVYTVDIDRPGEVRAAIQKALKSFDEQKVEPYMPYEYTAAGMLQRLNAYILNQDFCTAQPSRKIWPPKESISVILADPGVSCKKACMDKNLICEPSHFPFINLQQAIEKHGKCDSIAEKDEIFVPGIDKGRNQCLLQKQTMLFSCVGELPGLSRICPCRDFIRGQTALCSKCL